MWYSQYTEWISFGHTYVNRSTSLWTTACSTQWIIKMCLVSRMYNHQLPVTTAIMTASLIMVVICSLKHIAFWIAIIQCCVWMVCIIVTYFINTMGMIDIKIAVEVLHICPHFPQPSGKPKDLGENAMGIKCVLFFFTTYVQSIFNSDKYLVSYVQDKHTKSCRFSCKMCILLLQESECIKKSQFKIEWKSTLAVLALIHANRQTWQGK